jgi:crossover junction endodeoxyribonuclease RuvC
MGCAILKKNGKRNDLIYSVCLKTDKNLSFEKRLLSLGKSLEKIIKNYKPDIISLEKVFFFKNQKTASRISEVRGMILYLAAKNKIEVREYTPLQVKMNLTGYGRAEKFQVQKMVEIILKNNKIPKQDDEADAIAIALCA